VVDDNEVSVTLLYLQGQFLDFALADEVFGADARPELKNLVQDLRPRRCRQMGQLLHGFFGFPFSLLARGQVDEKRLLHLQAFNSSFKKPLIELKSSALNQLTSGIFLNQVICRLA
jgi:hypothetical protein